MRKGAVTVRAEAAEFFGCITEQRSSKMASGFELNISHMFATLPVSFRFVFGINCISLEFQACSGPRLSIDTCFGVGSVYVLIALFDPT